MPCFAEFCSFMRVVSFVARPWPAKSPGKNVSDRGGGVARLSAIAVCSHICQPRVKIKAGIFSKRQPRLIVPSHAIQP